MRDVFERPLFHCFVLCRDPLHLLLSSTIPRLVVVVVVSIEIVVGLNNSLHEQRISFAYGISHTHNGTHSRSPAPYVYVVVSTFKQLVYVRYLSPFFVHPPTTADLTITLLSCVRTLQGLFH